MGIIKAIHLLIRTLPVSRLGVAAEILALRQQVVSHGLAPGMLIVRSNPEAIQAVGLCQWLPSVVVMS